MFLMHSTVAILVALLCISAVIAEAPIVEFYAPELYVEPNPTRLPLTIKPSAYNLILRPYLLETDADRFTFDGEVYINITANETTNKLILHSNNLNYTIAQYWLAEPADTKLELGTPVTDTGNKLIFTLTNNQNFIANVKYTLYFKYVGSMGEDMGGFYRSSYVDEHNVTKWLGSTQFQSTGARRVFPSFDEPTFKATFDITIKRHKSMKSVSNTRIISSVLDGDYYIDVYGRTPVMSTYPLAFIVSEFNERYDGTFGVVARPEYYDQTEYPFTVGKLLISEFDKYLDMPYYEQGIDVLEMAAIPDFAAGAMENWGLITYKEDTLLYDHKSSHLKAKERIASVIAHEQAHMWFGDIVTCDWWSYTWLNEGFANYFQYFTTVKVETDMRLDQQFVVDQLQVCMELDSTNATNPMTNDGPVSQGGGGGNSQIVYNKAGSVIRMVRHAMGEDNFQKSLQEYLKAYAFKTAVPDNLLEYWEKHWPAATKAHAPLVFRSFTEQVGYPLVTITVSDDGRTMTANQTRFLLKSNDGSNASLLYTVPISYTTSVAPDFETTTPKFYLEASTATRTETLAQAITWVIANIQESGFYRVNYDIKNWHQIHQGLLSDKWGGIHELNRAQIVDDLFQLARAHVIEYDIALEILEYLDTELHYLPWTAAFNGYNYLIIRLGTDTKNFGVHIRKQLEKAYNQLGFDEKSGDTSLDIYTREKVLAWSCRFGNEDCISRAKAHFAQMQTTPVPPNIRTAVYCSALREGTESDYNALLKKFQTETVATEKTLIMRALGCVKDQKLIEKHLDNILSDIIRSQYKQTALSALYSENNENVTPVFDLVTRDFEKIADSMGGLGTVAGIISNIASRFTEESQHQKLKDFNTANKSKFGGSAVTLENAEKTVEENLAWASARLGKFKSYLEQRSRGSASAISSFTVLTMVLVAVFSMLLR